MCSFCEDIKTYESVKKEEIYDLIPQIVKMNDGEYGYFVPCDDYYYNHVELKGMEYCPFCGKHFITNNLTF